MNLNSVEGDPAEPDITNETTAYDRYWGLGGIINEKDYESALTRAEKPTALDKTRRNQAETIARFAGIELHSTADAIDPRINLYIVLRSDVQPDGDKYHHSQMSDQGIFAESLRMLGDSDSLDKLIQAYPNISFDYHDTTDYKKAA